MSDMTLHPETRIALFQRKEIRRTIHNNEWWFVITDVIAALTDSVDPQGYLKDMRRRDPEIAKGWGQIATPLSIATRGGPQNLNCANTEGIFRLIQSIPNPKAEPFKRWLARVGYERIQEIEDPELATKRTRAIYKAKGYSDDWIEKRMRSIAIRDELTDEWKKRGVKEQREYAILTAEISHATFGLTPSQYAEFKRLKRENLRDHMNDLELIFSMLGEAATTEIARNRDAQGFPQNKQVANEGGTVAGNARRELEKKSGRKVVTSENYLALTQSARRVKQLRGKFAVKQPKKS
ncbi:MAG: Bro-N domain-containing protein [Verrucomicrobia bacterium]|nr:Bro-N domain-containing protein [Verrucomicrobiota bacterium]